MDKIIEAIEQVFAAMTDRSENAERKLNAAVAELDDWLSMQTMSPTPISVVETLICKLATEFVSVYRNDGAVEALHPFHTLMEAVSLLRKMAPAPVVAPPVERAAEPHSKLYIWIDGEDDRGTPQWRTRLFIDGQPADKTDKAHTYGDRDYAIKVALGEVTDGDVIVEEPQPKPYLYILMRNDLASLNAGKAVAQGTHAANQMVKEARKRKGGHGQKDRIVAMLDEWEQEANGFGTCIVLSCNERQMRQSVADAAEAGEHAGICHDPTYPLLDGQTLHLLPVDTCAYIFGYKARVGRFMTGYPLMP